MSIELPLFRALAILPLYRGTRNPGRCTRVTFQTRNVGSAKLNQKICTSVFPEKVDMKIFWGWVTGPLNFHKQFRFGFRGSPVKTVVAAEYSASDESTESGGAEKKEMLNLSMSLFNEAKEIQEPELGTSGGPEIEDGGGQGGNRHGGDGKGNNNGRDAGSEGNDGLLRGSEWWWWWQWQRTHKIRSSQTGMGCGHSHSICLADSLAEMVAAETIKSLQLAVPPVSELLSHLTLDLDEIISFVMVLPFLFYFFLFEFPHKMARAWNISMGAILALVVVVPLTAMWGVLHWWRNCDQQDDNIGNDVEDDNGNIDGQGGNGEGGDGMQKSNSGFGGSEGGGDDLLRGLEWWWWWQWKRAHIRSHTSLRRGYSEPLWLADSMAQVVGEDMMRSLAPAVPAIDELVRLLALDQMVTFVLMLPFIVPLLFEIHDEVAQMTNMTMGAVFALLTVASLAVMYWLLFCWRNCDDNGNDSDNDSDNYNGDQ